MTETFSITNRLPAGMSSKADWNPFPSGVTMARAWNGVRAGAGLSLLWANAVSASVTANMSATATVIARYLLGDPFTIRLLSIRRTDAVRP
jgi:hypothetical protein